MEAEFLNMIIPYAVSTVVFLLLGTAFFLKDLIFNYFEKQKMKRLERKYGMKTVMRVKSVKKKSGKKTA